MAQNGSLSQTGVLMNIALFIITAAFLLFSLMLLLLPFYPTWREWKYPSDDTALEFSHSAQSKPKTAASEKMAHVRLSELTAAMEDVAASDSIEIGKGCHFQRLDAPCIYFGANAAPTVSAEPYAALKVLNPGNATRWGKNGLRIVGDFQIPDATFYEGCLIVTGTLSIGDDCLIQGDLKARQGLRVGSRTVIAGAVFCDESIHIQTESKINGPVLAATQLRIEPKVSIGTTQKPTTVSANHMLVEQGCVIHGTVWARDAGMVKEATA